MELRAAQRADPKLMQVIAALEKKPAHTYLSDPLADIRRVKARAARCSLSTDGLLIVRDEDETRAERPVLPNSKYDGTNKLQGTPESMTWKHLLLASAHQTAPQAHASWQDMRDELESLVYWNPPENLSRDCKTWVARCKQCTATHARPAHEPPSMSVRSYKPFYRIQIDFMEIKPRGENGEAYIRTALCISTRYPFFRVAKTRDQVECAELLLDILLDAGLVPSIVHSDNEFISLVLEELTTLLGSHQVFSTALRPPKLRRR